MLSFSFSKSMSDAQMPVSSEMSFSGVYGRHCLQTVTPILISALITPDTIGKLGPNKLNCIYGKCFLEQTQGMTTFLQKNARFPTKSTYCLTLISKSPGMPSSRKRINKKEESQGKQTHQGRGGGFTAQGLPMGFAVSVLHLRTYMTAWAFEQRLGRCKWWTVCFWR